MAEYLLITQTIDRMQCVAKKVNGQWYRTGFDEEGNWTTNRFLNNQHQKIIWVLLPKRNNLIEVNKQLDKALEEGENTFEWVRETHARKLTPNEATLLLFELKD